MRFDCAQGWIIALNPLTHLRDVRRLGRARAAGLFPELVVDVWNAQSSRLDLPRKKIKTRAVSAVK
jgi:hypothetical protein